MVIFTSNAFSIKETMKSMSSSGKVAVSTLPLASVYKLSHIVTTTLITEQSLPDAKISRYNSILLQTNPFATIASGHLIELEMAVGLTGEMHMSKKIWHLIYCETRCHYSSI